MATDYKSRLWIPIQGNPNTVFTTRSYSEPCLKVAVGYTRIVIGRRGPYIEFTQDMIIEDSLLMPDDQKYRLTDKRVYYLEFRTIDKCNVKVYYQLRTVEYADYKIGMLYISPFDLLADEKPIIERITLNAIQK